MDSESQNANWHTLFDHLKQTTNMLHLDWSKNNWMLWFGPIFSNTIALGTQLSTYTVFVWRLGHNLIGCCGNYLAGLPYHKPLSFTHHTFMKHISNLLNPSKLHSNSWIAGLTSNMHAEQLMENHNWFTTYESDYLSISAGPSWFKHNKSIVFHCSARWLQDFCNLLYCIHQTPLSSLEEGLGTRLWIMYVDWGGFKPKLLHD